MNGIRSRDRSALEEFHRMISPGARFLLERRLGKGNADEATGRVIEAVVREIRADSSLQPDALLSFVRTRIDQAADSRRNQREVPPPVGLRIAQQVLDRMSPLEQDALRMYYVAREPADKIMARLSLTLKQFRELRLRAREEFTSASGKKSQVA